MSEYGWQNGNYSRIVPEGQTELQFDDEKNLHIDQKEKKYAIVDENGQNAEEDALALLRGNKFDVKAFNEMYDDDIERVLMALLQIQSNENPLKVGGESIVFRCDLLIRQNRQIYNKAENTLLDIILGKMSSHPEDSFLTITAKEVAEELPYSDKKYIYKIMRTASKSLNRSPFAFEIALDNGNQQRIEIQWNEYLIYNGKSNLGSNEDAYISFRPTRFFRMIAMSSGIMHGAHYPVGVSSQIQSNRATEMFYFLESMKNYQEYPGATPGVFTISFEELRINHVHFPASYRPADIKRNVLDVSMKEINSAIGVDYNFDYEMIKTTKAGQRKQYTHVKFIITRIVEKKQIEAEDMIALPEKETPVKDDPAAMAILKGIGLTDKECHDVLYKYQKNNRDMTFLGQAITSVLTNPSTRNKTAVLCTIMDQGLNEAFSEENNKKRNASKPTQNKFHNFNQREMSDQDYDDLEERLLNNKEDSK